MGLMSTSARKHIAIEGLHGSLSHRTNFLFEGRNGSSSSTVRVYQVYLSHSSSTMLEWDVVGCDIPSLDLGSVISVNARGVSPTSVLRQ